MMHLYLLKRVLDSIQSADTKALPFNSPTNDGRSVTVDGTHIYAQDMKMCHDELMDEIETRIDKLLWGQFKLSEDQEIQDDPRNRNAGYSFISDLRNAWTTGTSVLEYIVSTPSLLEKFGSLDTDGSVIWHPGACVLQMTEIYEVQRLIAISLIMGGGQPGRAIEYACLLLCNIPGGSIRNVFWLMDVFMLRGSYNKTSHQSSEDKTMVRVPIPRLGRLVARFLIYLRPLYSEWQYHFRPKLYANSQMFLFAGLYRPVTARDLTLSLAQYTSSRLNARLTIRMFRQVMAYMMSYFEDVLDFTQNVTTASHQQLGHTGEIDRRHYGGDACLPIGLHRSELMMTARVSAVIHMIFGHPPTLLHMLEKGAEFRARLRDKINSIRNVHISSMSDPNSEGVPTKITIDSLGDALSSRLLPELISYNRKALTEAHASVVDMLFPFQSFSQSSPLPSVPTEYPHPSHLRKFRKFMGFPEDSTLGFKNIQQGVVIEKMYQGMQHLVYVSATGLCSKLYTKRESSDCICRIREDHARTFLCI
jgi:hypothetical protein